MYKYRKKPIIVHAVLYTGRNYDDILKFVDHMGYRWRQLSSRIQTAYYHDNDRVQHEIRFDQDVKMFIIDTLEGELALNPQHYLICGIEGELYPCRRDIFEKTYEVIHHSDSIHYSDN